MSEDLSSEAQTKPTVADLESINVDKTLKEGEGRGHFPDELPGEEDVKSMESSLENAENITVEGVDIEAELDTFKDNLSDQNFDELKDQASEFEDTLDGIQDGVEGTNLRTKLEEDTWVKKIQFVLALLTGISLLLYCWVACSSSPALSFSLVIVSAVAAAFVIAGHHSFVLATNANMGESGREPVTLEETWASFSLTARKGQAWLLWVSMVSCIFVLPYIALIILLSVISLVSASKLNLKTACNVLLFLNRCTKWGFIFIIMFSYLFETATLQGEFDILVLGKSYGTIPYSAFYSAMNGALFSICGMALICLLTYRARMGLEKRLVMDAEPVMCAGTPDEQTNYSGQVSVVVASRDRMTARLGHVGIGFLLVSWIIPLGYIQKGGLVGELLQGNTRQTSSFADVVINMLTDPVLVAQRNPIIFAIVFIFINLVTPFVEFMLLSRAATAARKNPAESRRYLQWAEFFSIFDCTEVAFVFLLVQAIEIEKMFDIFFEGPCAVIKPQLSNPQVKKASAILNIDTTIEECIIVGFKFGPAPIAMFNTWVLRSLVFNFVKDMISRSTDAN